MIEIKKEDPKEFSIKSKEIKTKKNFFLEKSNEEEHRADERHYNIILFLLLMILLTTFIPLIFGIQLDTNTLELLKITKTLLFEIFLLDIIKKLSKNVNSLEYKSKSRILYIFIIAFFTFIITVLLTFALV
jgi:uncharacterized ion transporter superfamily protein YfcC